MKIHAIRLKPYDDLKMELDKFTRSNKLTSGFIITCVGSLLEATIRLANQKVSRNLKDKFEIVSLVGTLSQDGLHLHIALSNSEGKMIGGHLEEGCFIYTTAEIVIGDSDQMRFTRVIDNQTGYDELVISDIPDTIPPNNPWLV